MSKQNNYIIGIALTLLLGSWLYHKYCCNCPRIKTTKKTELHSLNQNFNSAFLIEGGGFNYLCDKNFNFLRDSINHESPVNKCVEKAISNLKTFLKAKPNAIIEIKGYCLNSEKNKSAFPNLGYARANNVKNYLISKGIPSNKFEIKGEIKTYLKQSQMIINGPVCFSIVNDITKAKGIDWNFMKEKLNKDPLMLYFNTNQTEIVLTPEERSLITDITRYLDNVTSAKLYCEGHTDNTGDRNINMQLGLNNANFAREYFIKNGIQADRIEVTSKGPDEPIADNFTPEGKAKNRRTIITIR
jgi:OmpA-OmpF porin, OOP family